jgi:DNA-directed RNA polymerase specialized sigma24 family protein
LPSRREPRPAPADAAGERPAHEQLSDAIPAIARRIRSLRRQDSDWSMRTSELMSSTVRRVLIATEGGHERMGTRNFWGLVETIVRHLLIDRFRRKGVRRAVMRRLRDESGRHEDADPAPDAVVASRDAAVRLVLGLTDDERALLELRMRGLGWKQVGEVLGIAEDAARQRWAALRRKARTAALQEAQ